VSGRPEEPEQGHASEGWDEVSEILREMLETLGPQPREARMAHLLAVLTARYRAKGEPEPPWLIRARELGQLPGEHHDQT
jgi:hypothetical protein